MTRRTPAKGARQGEPKVSVLLPTFNRASYIRESVESLLAQTWAPFEIIILDDGSTDGTAEVCAQFGPPVSYVRIERNGGKSAAINRGLERAAGDFIWIMDDDDIAPPRALETLLAPMRASPDIGFTYGRLLKFALDEETGLRVFGEDVTPAADSRPLFVRLMEDCFITGQPCVLFRRACFDAIGVIDETIVASVDYNILLLVARRFAAADVGAVVLWQRQHLGARGPAQFRYRSQQRVEQWMAFDKRLLGQLLPQLSLEELVSRPSYGLQLSAVEQRRALFQKAVIAGRKDLWELAVASLTEARTHAGHEPLDLEDRGVLSKLFGSRYGVDAFAADRSLQRRLAASAGDGAVGADIRREISAMLPYRIGSALRAHDPKRARLAFVALFRVAGPGGLAQLALRLLVKRIGGRTTPGFGKLDWGTNEDLANPPGFGAVLRPL